ncbi:MAG TPA: tetratricopeptide repeat protein [Vicinamibacteria bacterium]|nr:tetratricopeptide repeat protein [Vicinamibacteria bacterium]
MTASTGAPQPAASSTGAGRDWGQWIKDHQREVLLAIGAVAVVAAAAWMYVTSEGRKEAFAAQALSKARGDAQAGDIPLTAYDLTQLIDRYSGTKAADEGIVMLAQVRLVQGGAQVDQAVRTLRTFLQSSHPDYAMGSAWALLGSGLEQQHKYRDAAQAYLKAAEVSPYDFLKAQNLLDAGRTLSVAGDSAGARKAYSDVIERFGQLNQSAEARVRLGELGGTEPAPKGQTSSDQKAG